MNTMRVAIAQVRARLAAILEDVERGCRVELTRRGTPVAVMLSLTEYEKLAKGPRTFEKAFEEFRDRVELESLDISPDLFEGLRDRSPGREARF